ncbi:MAG: NAD(+)/NADH kinase [Metallosphaera yellowstonensis]|jgi:Predicted sugar kinase
MKLKIVAKNSQLVEPIISRIKDASKRLGITLVDEGEEVVMAVGGDGTLLKAIKLDKPVIAVKAGRRGFFMDVEPSEVEEALAKLLSGEYFREEYDLLRLRYHGRSLDAFNEVGVLYDEPESILLSLDFMGNHFVMEGDGVLISTPQGSSGWSMSVTGVYVLSKGVMEVSFVGPILSPLKALVIPGTNIKLRLEDKGHRQKARLVSDGDIVDYIFTGEEVTIEPSPKKAIILRFKKVDPLRGIIPWKG